MKIVSWNILQGGGQRLDAILAATNGWRADIIALQEVRARNAPQMADHFAAQGLPHHYMSDHLSDTENGIFLAARRPIEAGDFIENREGLCHILEAEIAGLTILPVHFPQKAAQVPLFEAVLRDSPSLLDHNAVLLGDLNCGIPFEDSSAKTFVNAKYFQAWKEAGWIDAYRHIHGQDARDYSWISPRTDRGFRYDHALLSPSLAPKVATLDYDHSVRTGGLSDHSALIVELKDLL